MLDCEAVADALHDPDADPRLDAERVRCLPGAPGAGAVVLVGVVHDHPASVFRVTHLIERIAPDVLALELPPLAVPLFRLYARDGRPPRLGGEMSAAVAAAGDATVVGIDAPNRSYLRLLWGELRARRPPAAVVRAAARDLAAGLGHALACRLGAAIGGPTGLRPRVYERLVYETSLLDPPAAQADHERAHVARRRALAGAVATPPAIALVDESREADMARRLAALRADGGVLAVIGVEHLDAVETRLHEA